VIELVAPVLIERSHVGSLFLGPAVEPGARTRVDASQLPRRSAAELKKLGALAAVVAAHIADVGEVMLTQGIQASRHSEPAARGIEFAELRYGEPITVEDAARHAFLSPSRFAHVFSDEMGVPFHAYLTALRIGRAKKLLARSTLPIGRIAELTGFCNQNYFASVFREHAGATPTAYRAANAKPVEA
jgi:transcriptional regulator GlxA family with amidase domain